MTKAGKVFLSHASEDKLFVERLVADLVKHSIPVWYDKFDLNIDSGPGLHCQLLSFTRRYSRTSTRTCASQAPDLRTRQ